jgi:hypothetical protein
VEPAAGASQASKVPSCEANLRIGSSGAGASGVNVTAAPAIAAPVASRTEPRKRHTPACAQAPSAQAANPTNTPATQHVRIEIKTNLPGEAPTKQRRIATFRIYDKISLIFARNMRPI